MKLLSRLRAAALAFSESAPRAASRGPVLEEVSAEETQESGEWLEPRDEVLRVHGQGDLSIYEKLLTDGQVYSTFRQRRIEIIAREWQVDPGAEDELSIAAADDMRQQLQRIGWDRVCYRMLAGEMYGYAVGEPMFSLGADGHVLIDAVKVRRSARFGFAPDGSLRMRSKGKPVALPEKKIWLFRAAADTDDDPYGFALGQILYWLVWFKRHGFKFWTVFLERFANPTPKATVPAGTSHPERQKLLEMLGRITHGGRIIVPRGVDVELIQAIRSSGGDFDTFLRLVDQTISKTLLLQTMTTDDGSSYSQARVHERVAIMGAKTLSDLLDESFMATVGAWLTEWNYPGAARPILYRDFDVAQDLQALAQRDQILSGIGWRPKARYIADTYGDNYEYSPPPAVPGLAFAEPAPRVTPVGELLEEHEWHRILGPEVEHIEALLADCRTLPEFRDRLGELAMHDPAQLTDTVARLFFTARLAGNAEAELEDSDADPR